MRLIWSKDLTAVDHSAAVGKLRRYFGMDPGSSPYTGASFDRLFGGGDRGDVRDVLTAEDLVAVTTLSVEVLALAALRILGVDGRRISDLLRLIPTSLDLADVDVSTAGES